MGADMTIGVFDLFKVGIGPSSSHTVGPMRAANTFVARLAADGLLARTAGVRAEMFGSLGVTGHGHGTVKAVVLGLEGEQPDLVDPEAAEPRVAAASTEKELRLGGTQLIAFSMDDDLVLHRRKRLPFHSNGMRFTARGADGHVLMSREYYSVGGGFILDEDEIEHSDITADDRARPVPHPFSTGNELLQRTRATGLSISDVMLANELTRRSEEEIRSGLVHIWSVMQECVNRGIRATGTLPGGLNVRRRAGRLRQTLESTDDSTDPLRAMEWVTLYALAVNEENAAGGRVVTAPTNGAAGIVPAVLPLLPGLRRLLLRGRCRPVPAHRRGRRDPVQGERLHLRGRGGLPGRDRLGVLDGGGRAGGGPRRNAGPGRERGGDRHRAQPRTDLRSHRRAGADPVHRAQRHRVDQGHHRRADGCAW